MKPELHIVLYQPEIPQNTGNIVRTCAAFGAILHLVEPLGFRLEDRYLKRAGLDYWPQVDLRRHGSLEDFFASTAAGGEALPGAGAGTDAGTDAGGAEACFYITKKASRSLTEVEFPPRSFFLFGPETRGLPDDLLTSHPDRCLRIPMREGARSLNLSNAVAILAFEFFRRRGFPGLAQAFPGGA